MSIQTEVANITVLVPFNRTGTSFSTEIVPFKVYKIEERYRAIPLLIKEERQHTTLPAELWFEIMGDTVVPGDDYADQLNVIKAIGQELRIQHLRY